MKLVFPNDKRSLPVMMSHDAHPIMQAPRPSPAIRDEAQWTVVTTVSTGFLDMFQNWLYWYRRLQLRSRLVVVVEDSGALSFARASNLTYRHGAALHRPDADDGAWYDSGPYRTLVSRRAAYLLRELEECDYLLYTDVDTVWLSNPFVHLRGVHNDMWGGVDDVIRDVPYYCTGFLAFRRTPASRSLLRQWNDSLFHKPQLNQPVFNSLLRRSDAVARPLPRSLFPSGDLYFGRATAGRQAVVVHNNFVQGKRAKIRRFRERGLYHPCRVESFCTENPTKHQCDLAGERMFHEFRACVWGVSMYGTFECRADFAMWIATACM